MIVAILRTEEVDVDAVRRVQDGLPKAFPHTKCVILDDFLVPPREAYDATRNQHHSTVVLSAIRHFLKKGDTRINCVLGVVDVDLYMPRLNFVFGEAECPGKAALISLFRLKPQFYGRSEDEELLFERSVKEAVHEVGHTLGLRHCNTSTCVMSFSNSIFDTDKKGRTFCEKCHHLVARTLSQRP